MARHYFVMRHRSAWGVCYGDGPVEKHPTLAAAVAAAREGAARAAEHGAQAAVLVQDLDGAFKTEAQVGRRIE
jgi:hypothetical protein